MYTRILEYDDLCTFNWNWISLNSVVFFIISPDFGNVLQSLVCPLAPGEAGHQEPLALLLTLGALLGDVAHTLQLLGGAQGCLNQLCDHLSVFALLLPYLLDVCWMGGSHSVSYFSLQIHWLCNSRMFLLFDIPWLPDQDPGMSQWLGSPWLHSSCIHLLHKASVALKYKRTSTLLMEVNYYLL